MVNAAGSQADVIVVGAGPAGSTAAHYLADSGCSVILLDKATFPRTKVCGDGLTPRAVRELIALGIKPDETGWIRNKGLRVFGGGHRLELPWPQLTSYPDYGLTRARRDFDNVLLTHARKAGAVVHQQMTVTGAIRHERTGRILGVTAERRAGGEVEQHTFRAPIVMAADGVSSRLATSVGREKLDNRPMGVAIRAYYRSPRHIDDYMESHLELWDGKPGASNLMPGYGWIFALGDGTVNVGLGSVSSTAQTAKLNYRDLMRRWTANTPPEWELTEENLVERPASAALPMAFNRKPLYAGGLMLLGDAGGMVSPFNGEGIAYAMQSGRLAADVAAQALARRTPISRERALRAYPQAMSASLGGYFSLGRIFVKLIEHPQVMHICTRYGLPRPTLMRFTMKLLADMYEPRGGDTMDRVIAALARIAPAA